MKLTLKNKILTGAAALMLSTSLDMNAYSQRGRDYRS